MSGRPIEEIDTEMVEKEQEYQKTHQINAPEDLYAQYFYLYGIQFRNLVDRMSQNAVRRVLKAIVEHPLAEKEYDPTTEEEKNALLIGLRLLESKQMMILHAMTQHMLEDQNKTKVAEEKQGEPNGQETNNGGISSEVEGNGKA